MTKPKCLVVRLPGRAVGQKLESLETPVVILGQSGPGRLLTTRTTVPINARTQAPRGQLSPIREIMGSQIRFAR